MFVTYRRKSVMVEDSGEALKLAESFEAESIGESTVNVSVYWRMLEL